MADVNARLGRLYRRSFDRMIPGLPHRIDLRKVVPCGLFSPPDYESCRRRGKRTVIILKEPWSSGGVGWSWLKEGRRAIRLYSRDIPWDGWGPLVSQMGRLGYLIAVCPPPARYQRLPAFEAVTRPLMADGMKCMGIMNVKKTTDGTGYKTTPDWLVRQWGTSTMHILTEELEIMDPDIVLCGGKVVYDVMAAGLNAQPPMQKTISTKKFQYSLCRIGSRQGVKLIEVYHPSQAPPQPSYELLGFLKRKQFI